jgi:hypothetical protein
MEAGKFTPFNVNRAKRKLLYCPERKTDCNEKCIPYHAHPDIRLSLEVQLLLELRGGVTGDEH